MPHCRARLTCAQCFEHSWLKQDTRNMEAKQLSKERMKKYILRRRWQVRALHFILIYSLNKEWDSNETVCSVEVAEFRFYVCVSVQKTGNAVRAISRFSSMGMLGGIGPKKSSPTDGMAQQPISPLLEHIGLRATVSTHFFSSACSGSIFFHSFLPWDFKRVFVINHEPSRPAIRWIITHYKLWFEAKTIFENQIKNLFKKQIKSL